MTKDDLLDDLDITADELGRIRHAFKDAEFKKLFAEYVDEIADPDNRRIYEQELAQLEAERGIDITFIHPVAGYVIKTVTAGQHKTFINVAECAVIGRPQSRCGRNEAGQSGLNWSLPYAQSPVRKDYDRKQQLCRVYDVVFHPDTLHLTRKNAQFKELVTRTTLDAVRSAFGVDVDAVNFKYPKIGFKGTPRSTVIRKRAAEQPERMPEASPLDGIYPPLAAERKAATNGREKCKQPMQQQKPAAAAAAEYTEPKYTLVHRKHVEYHELTDELDAKVGAAIPHELVLTVELPLLRSCDDAQLDVTSESVFLISERPAKYRLRVELPYAVCEQRGKASFDSAKRRLVVTLPVVRAPLTVAEICGQIDPAAEEQNGNLQLVEVLSEDSSSAEETTSASASPPPESPEAVAAPAGFLDAHCLYELPHFDCENFGKSLLFTLHVKNVDPQTLAVQQQSHSVHIRFQSVGAGYFPQHHAFFVRLPAAIGAVQPEVWDNDVIVQLELSAATNVDRYEAGMDADALEQFQCERPVEDVFEDAEDGGGGDAFRMAEVQAALPAVASPQKLKQRSYSESHAVDMEVDDDDDGEEEDDGEDGDDDEEEYDGKQPKNGQATDKMRTESECSVDGGGKCLKGILKRRSSSVLSESQSSFDEPCCRSIDLSRGGSIPEECGAEHCKKSVRFDNNIRKLLFRFNSTVAGQRKPKANKRKKKKRCTERRYSEGEASDYDPKQSETTKAELGDGDKQRTTASAKGAKKTSSSAHNKLGASTAKHLHDSGVDLREDATAEEEAKCDVNFRSGMIFELDM